MKTERKVLYKNFYRSKEGKLVVYQNYHESTKEAIDYARTQSNGDVYEFTQVITMDTIKP